MGRKFLYGLIALTAIATTISSCQKAAENASVAAPKSIYVASGLCNSGSGITTYNQSTSSRAVTKWASDTGKFTEVFTDLNLGSNVSVNTVPQSLIDKGDYVLMLTENATTTGDRKVFKINKSNPGTYITYANDPTAFTAVAGHITRSMAQDVDGTLIFSKSLMAERLNTLGVRLAKAGANPWVNPLAATGNCFTGAASLIGQVTLMAPFTGMNQGKLIYLHSGATAAVNRIGIIQRTGLTSATAADCVVSNPAGGLAATPHVNAPNLNGPVIFSATGASPTAMVYIPTPSPALTSGKLIVSYSGSTATAFDNNTNFNYGVVMWDITETSDTAATIGNPVILWRDESTLWAPSALAFDSTTNSLFVAVGGSPGLVNQTTQNFGYNIEKFTLDINTPLMTRVAVNNQPFIIGNAYTKCISSMIIAN